MRKRYNNLHNVGNMKSWEHFQRWQKSRIRNRKDYSYTVPHAESKEIEFLKSNRTETTITWIGHSTFFIQMAGLNILTDPVWASRMGINSRLSPPGITLSDMPEIDVVLISHSHYDHLHFSSIRKLKGDPVYFVPEGLGRRFVDKGLHRVEQFSWWKETGWGKLSFSFVPAQHWSKRTPWDTNTSHWGGWVLGGKGVKQREYIYFAGDTGYFPGFKVIGRMYPVDYVLMPIGAYEPEWFMHKQHVSPEEAVKAFLDIRGEVFIPMHYGTFRLADDTPLEALERLEAAWKEHRLDEDRLKILSIGETMRTSKIYL